MRRSLIVLLMLAVGCAGGEGVQTAGVEQPPNMETGTPPPSEPGPTEVQKTTVPRLVGLHLSGAKALLEDAGLVWLVRRQVTTDSPPGTVISQKPKAGKDADQFTIVTLVVAKAPASPSPEPEPACHPSYEGACLMPDASDYDCAGGSGDGPYYTGRVSVVGPDVFGLDGDGDGVGCE